MSDTAPSPYTPPKARLEAERDGEPIHAGFWRRGAAYFIDMLITYAIILGLTLVHPAAGGLAVFLFPLFYFTLMHCSSKQASLGKMAVGIKVTTLEGERISFLRSLGRYLGSILSGVILSIGYLMAAFTDRKQALHDMMAGTLVVRSTAEPDEIVHGTGTMKLTVGVIVFGVILVGGIPVTGILAAIAIPAYQDYLTRSQVSASVMEARNARTAIEQHYASKRELPASLAATGYAPSSPYVSRVEAKFTGGVIEIRAFPSPLVRAAAGGNVLLRSPAPPASFEWTCSGEDLKPKYLPQTCRGPS